MNQEPAYFPRQPVMPHSAPHSAKQGMDGLNMPHHVGERHRDFGIFLDVTGKVNVALPHRSDSRRDQSWEAITPHAGHPQERSPRQQSLS